ncbi:cation:proton antiporter [Helicobacter bilis]|uniref:Potassium transporter KefB n=1 Tax=Helicobacter bilis TaxID=37372 RepID=A0A4U8UEN5_9HELI|nr:cation:proton antiporter [Helicobacter bilis]MDD7297116.1 cation:proton antiporter [Helicobacter bilis]MDY4399897.1 cation:proton antiporter [Helicobacter bilis]TLE09055.1 potassium transporter KefB [Helicobacter bilis]TLE11180.1 potassium transporter KefB [Helicobacter bilis]
MAVISGIVLSWLKIPTIIGYILTGVLTTYIFGFHLEDSGELNDIAEFGVVFLMFMIGLDFSFKSLTSMKQEVLVFGGLQIGISIAFFYVVCFYFLGFNFSTSIIISSAVSLSSTAIVLKFLNESAQTKTPYGMASVGILIFQDIAVIPILLMIKLLSDKDSHLSALLLTTLISAIIVLIVLFLPGRIMAKLFLRFSANMKTDEIFVGAVFLIVLGAAYISKSFGFSLALGAFLAGMIISNTPYKYQVSSVLTHFRDILLGVFFITVGMQVDIIFLLEYFVVILILMALMMGAKALLMYLFLFLFRGQRIGLRIALSLAQIGEFSFAIFLLASQHKILDLHLDGGVLKVLFGEEFFASITPDKIYQFLTLMVIFSMIATPFILDRLDKVTNFFLRYLTPVSSFFAHRKAEFYDDTKADHTNHATDLEKHVVVCGYGELGKKILEYFKGCDVQYIAVDKNYNKVEEAIKKGEPVIYGDITSRQILEQLGITKCSAVIIAIDSIDSAQRAHQDIRALSPYCKIILKTKSSKFASSLQSQGVYAVVHERREVAKILSDLALQAVDENKQQADK